MKSYYENENSKLYCGDSIKILKKLQEKSIDMIFADPPYFLSNDGITCSNGKMVSVNKGEWDKSKGFNEDVKFHKKWIKEFGFQELIIVYIKLHIFYYQWDIIL